VSALTKIMKKSPSAREGAAGAQGTYRVRHVLIASSSAWFKLEPIDPLEGHWAWCSIAEVVNRLFAIARTVACEICGSAPCINPGFYNLCRQADVRARSKPTSTHFEAKADASTVEALMFSLRSRGTPALEESDAQQRLVRLSEDQVRALGVRLQRISPDIAKPWGADEVVALVSKWTSLHG
jgi:hypothetical protein